MSRLRGVPGEQACVTCFEESCSGCQLICHDQDPEPEREEPSFDFDCDTHTYMVDGKIVPGVTELVSILGGQLPSEGDDLELTFDAAAERGTLLHGYLEHRIWGGEPQGYEVPDVYSGYVQAIELFLAEHNLAPVYVETPLWGEANGVVFAGTPDFVGDFDGKLAILDWKFVSAVQKVMVGAQLAGYYALCERDELQAERMACVQFLQDGTYRLYPAELNRADFNLCLAVWAAKNRKQPRGGIA